MFSTGKIYLVCVRNSMASAQKEQNIDFLNSNNEQKHNEMPGEAP